MGDQGESDSAAPRDKFSKYIRRIEERLNSGPIEKKFVEADVYDSTAVILNRNRIPGSRGKGKDNARGGKGARWKGRREEDVAGGIENPGGCDNYQSQG